MKECGRVYRQGKEAAAKEAGDSKPKEPSKAAKAKEVEAEKRKERGETAKRRAEHARALKEDDTRVKKAVTKTERPAKEAHRKKLREVAEKSKRAMRDESDARALAKVQARRRVTTKSVAA